MKQVIYGFILIICGLSYQACDIFDSPCRFEEFVIPVEIYPMKDTFHAGDTMHVHIEFPTDYQYKGETYSISSENIDFAQFVGFIQDTNVLILTALKNSEIIVDTSNYNVFKYQFSVDGSYSIIGDIESQRDSFIVDYAVTFLDTGIIRSSFLYFPGEIYEDPIQFANDCSAEEYSFHLQLQDGQDNNYKLYLNSLSKYGIQPPSNDSAYISNAAYTFYVVE